MSRVLPMPETFSDFARYLLAMSIIAAVAVFHIWTAMKITGAKMELQQIQAGHVRLQQENAELLWQLSQHTNLDQVYSRAANLGFRETVIRRYIRAVEPLSPTLSPPSEPAGAEPGGPALLQPSAPVMVLTDPISNPVQAWAGELQAAVQEWWNQLRSELVQHWQSFVNGG